ncbi:hypothetical protein [Bacillus altitudinis]
MREWLASYGAVLDLFENKEWKGNEYVEQKEKGVVD